MSFRLSRVAALLFLSGACALVYQVAWFRELRLIFGASTAASAAVLAVFMGGLGVGGALLGRRADAAKNPLGLYANLELVVSLTAAATPGTVWLAQKAYLAVGGASTLGEVGATVMRLVLSFLVLAPSTIAMGGTLPAAARAVERESDLGRQRLATLYGVNTFGAVVGTLAANFLFLEVFGNRLTLWLACLANLLVGLVARSVSRSLAARVPAAEEAEDAAAVASPDADAAAKADASDLPAARFPWFPPAAAAVAGLAFMLMELVWYRMLAPLLGGSSYTFGLILAVALLGIGIGGALYARTKAAATLTLFAVTCSLEALAIAIPYALGDRLAFLAGLLRPLCAIGFSTSILAWSAIVCIVVLPAAIVSGFQFPAIIGLYGRGERGVGRDVGQAYLANTAGSIVGAIAGGFGLLPILSAPRVWLLVCLVLVAAALVAVGLELGRGGVSARRVLGASLPALAAAALVFAPGPSHVWRHAGIGAGRTDAPFQSPNAETLISMSREWGSMIKWEQDGRESAVALSHGEGYSFIVNGKTDGHVIIDAGTQIMSGLLAALLHPEPRRALVIGLGTGSTAGWLGAVPAMERVDVFELEPAILRVAKDCGPVNQNVLDSPKVKVQIGDARELLRTSRERYDLVFSEPSNPYRAGISSLYTREYYEAVRERLAAGGVFAQWVQAYEVDGWAIATVMITLREVFPHVSVWETADGDLVLIAQAEDRPVDVGRLRQRVGEEPYRTALRAVWGTASAEGVLAHHVARRELADVLAEHELGAVNVDDQNFLEFAFARSVGHHTGMMNTQLAALAARLELHRPHVQGSFDEQLWLEEKLAARLLGKEVFETGKWPLDLTVGRALTSLDRAPTRSSLEAWRKVRSTPRSHAEAMWVAEAAARSGDPTTPERLPETASAVQKAVLRAIWHHTGRRRAETIAAVEEALLALRDDPWLDERIAHDPLRIAVQLGSTDRALSARLAKLLEVPFAVEYLRQQRLEAMVALARGSGDAELCRHALDEVGLPRWSRLLLESRVDCFRRTSDPRLPEAEADLVRYLTDRTPFGAGIAPQRPVNTAIAPSP